MSQSNRYALDNPTKSRMLALLARELDLGRAGRELPEVSPREWRAVLEEASRLFADGTAPKAQATRTQEPGATRTQEPGATRTQEPGATRTVGSDDPARPVLFTDGACRGNPGPSAAGAVVYLGQDEVGTVSQTLGVMTNNQAEYEALYLGLKLVRELGFKEVSIRSDSQLLVRQIQGRYKVKNPNLKPLFQRVKALLKEFSEYDIVHLVRGLNSVADGLANQALDNAGG